MVRKGYRNLSVPNQLYEELENFVTESKGRYVSVAEVVREAVRDFLKSDKQHPRKS
jgi:Arc/MetJ-type ribon-helix-helix transcriptional regulator